MKKHFVLTKKDDKIAIVHGQGELLLGIEAMMSSLESHEVEDTFFSSMRTDKYQIKYMCFVIDGGLIYMPIEGYDENFNPLHVNEISEIIRINK
jgi:hypothetical protein